MEGAPEPTCRKMLDGLLAEPKVEDGRGLFKVDHRTADIPCIAPVPQEFLVVR
jgi:hypothetical protein